jgi:hypothetical protein
MLRHPSPTNEQGWLETAVDEPVEIVCNNGEILVGILRGHDERAIVLETDAAKSAILIYKREVRLIRR